MNLELLLNAEIETEFEKLKELEVGSDTYRTTVDGLMKLADRAIELEKVKIAKREKSKSQHFDNELKTKQFELDAEMKRGELKVKSEQTENDRKLKVTQINNDKNDRFIGYWIAAAGIAIPAGITIWGTLKSLNFEKEGTVTTLIGRGFINKLLPKK